MLCCDRAKIVELDATYLAYPPYPMRMANNKGTYPCVFFAERHVLM